MALLAGILTFLGRMVGRVANTLFGWATVALFGRLPDPRRSALLGVISLAALAWLAAAVGILFPDFGLFLLALLEPPEGVPPDWVRLSMVAAVATLPLLVGVLSWFMPNAAERPAGWAAVRTIIQGYPYTIGLALTLILLVVTVPLLKIRSWVRRYSDEHIPLVIQPDGYETVVRDISHTLEHGGIPTKRTQPPLLLEAPVQVLRLFARGSLGRLAADRLVLLRGQEVELLLYPADLVVSGKGRVVARARMVLTQDLPFTAAYLTWSDEGQRLEEELQALWQELAARPGGPTEPEVRERMDRFRTTLSQSELPYEQWEILYRMALQVETRLFRMARQPAPQVQVVERVVERVVEVPRQPAAVAANAPSPAPEVPSRPPDRAPNRPGVPGLLLLAAAGVVVWRLFTAPRWERDVP